MPLVSAIIPFYNQARFLKKAVESVLSQTLTDIEVIVVDDGSNEDPIAVLTQLQEDSRLKVHRQHNQGVALARNSAIAMSTGRYLHFIDADDWIAPTMYATLSQRLEADQRYGMVYCDIYRVRDDESPADDLTVAESRADLTGDILPSLITGGYFPPVSVLVRSSVIREVGNFDQTLGGCSDWDLWMRIAALRIEATFESQRLAYYRIHDGSMSKDVTHMTETAIAALTKNMQLNPTRIAESIQTLIRTSEAVYAAKEYVAQKSLELESSLSDSRKYCDELLERKDWIEKEHEFLIKRIKNLEGSVSEIEHLRQRNLELESRSNQNECN